MCFTCYEKWVQREKYPNNTCLHCSKNSNYNGSYTNLRGRWARCRSILHLLSVGVLYPVHKGMLWYHQFMILKLGLDSRLDNSIPLMDSWNQLCSRAGLSIPAILESSDYNFSTTNVERIRYKLLARHMRARSLHEARVSKSSEYWCIRPTLVRQLLWLPSKKLSPDQLSPQKFRFRSAAIKITDKLCPNIITLFTPFPVFEAGSGSTKFLSNAAGF